MAPNALLGLLPFAAFIALAGVGQTLVVQQRGLDLTVAAMITLSAILITKIPNGRDAQLPIALVTVAAVAIVAGLLSGIAVTRFGITSVVATLGVGALLTGLALQVTGGALSIAAAPALDGFAFGKSAGIPNVMIVVAAFIVAAAFLIRGTVIGRWFIAVGANPAAAHAAGLPVRQLQIGTYVVASLVYGLTGILLAGFVGTPGIAAGDPYLLATVAAVVLGGTSLAGGKGSVIATAGGAMFLTQLGAVVLGMGAPPAAQLIIQGTIIAVGMGLRNVPWQGLRRAAASSGRGSSRGASSTTPPAGAPANAAGPRMEGQQGGLSSAGGGSPLTAG